MVFNIPNDWEYRGEGNSHVVLSLPQLKKVLRIRKRSRPNNIFQWCIHLIERYFSGWMWWNIEAEKRDSLFHSNVMMPLLGFSYVSAAENVLLSAKELRKVELTLNKLRPDFRKHKVLQFGRATLFHDFAYMDVEIPPQLTIDNTYSFEIKPKKGWIPSSEKHFPECIFCMNQLLKLDARKITKLSEYCPELFFSGNEADIKKSLLALIDNPQNNLKIFKNGNLIFGENSSNNNIDLILHEFFDGASTPGLVNDLVHLLYQCLIKNFELKSNSSECEKCIEKCFSSKVLPNGCVLERIMSVQMLDLKGTEHYEDIILDKTSEWDYVNILLKLLNEMDCRACMGFKLSELKKDLNFICYLVAAVANDCSLMITFKKLKKSNIVGYEMDRIVSSRHGNFFVGIGVFDLYPKPFSTIRKHQQRNTALVKRFTKV